MLSEYYHIIHVIDTVLYFFIVVAMCCRFRWYEQQPLQVRLYQTGLWLLLLASAFGSLELLHRGVPAGPFVVVVLGPLVILTIAALLPALCRLHDRARRGKPNKL